MFCFFLVTLKTISKDKGIYSDFLFRDRRLYTFLKPITTRRIKYQSCGLQPTILMWVIKKLHRNIFSFPHHLLRSTDSFTLCVEHFKGDGKHLCLNSMFCFYRARNFTICGHWTFQRQMTRVQQEQIVSSEEEEQMWIVEKRI